MKRSEASSSKMLIEYGYTTIEAIDGADAIEQFKKADKIDLLILDSVMPKKNGGKPIMRYIKSNRMSK